MSAAKNKNALKEAFDALSKGDGGPFIDLWADDFTWSIIGSTPWSKTFSGRESVQRDLMAPLFSNFATKYTNTATRFIAEGNYVVIECQGNVTTKAGQPYNNTYCYVCEMVDGKLKALKEYSDTDLIARVLEAP